MPVQSERDTLADAAHDVLVVEVGIRVADANIPGSPATLDTVVAVVDQEEVLERLYATDGAALTAPGNVLARQVVRPVEIATPQVDVGASRSLKPDVLPLANDLGRAEIDHSFQTEQFVGVGTGDAAGVDPALCRACFRTASESTFIRVCRSARAVRMSDRS